MKKELNQNALEELSFMKNWNWVIIDFFVRKKYGDTIELLFQVNSDTFERKDLRGMRMIYKDYNDMTTDLTPNDQSELNQILKDKFGFDLSNVNDKNLKKIQQIIHRGHLNSDEEFRLLSNREDEIYADDSKKDETATLQKLMKDYEDEKKSRLLKKRT